MGISESRPWVAKYGVAVLPKQVEAMRKDLKERGIVADVRDDGTIACYSRKARKELMKFRELHDRDGYYGDYTGR
jgi:hypothetical protein